MILPANLTDITSILATAKKVLAHVEPVIENGNGKVKM